MEKNMNDKLLEWFATGRIGASSRAIAHKMMGFVTTPDRNYPHDPDDLNRCLLLLEAVPEIRPRMKEMADVCPEWARLVARWEEIERTFLDEVGLNWCHGHTAPKTYEMMRQCLCG